MLSRPDFLYKQILFVFTNQGEKFSFKNDNVIIHDKDAKIKYQSTCYRLFVLFIVGHTTISSGLLQRSKKFHFSIILLGHNLKPYATFNTQTEGNVLLRRKQYLYNQMTIAQHIVINKIQSQRNTLKRVRDKNDKQKKAIKQLKHSIHLLKNENFDLTVLLGIEGQAAKSYFRALYDQENWKGRKPRTKIDPINTLLDIGYTLLFNMVESLLNLYGFDIYQGVYHQCFYQRKSLVCDLMEPMRPIIDYRIRKANRLGQIKLEDFRQDQGRYILFGKQAIPYSTFLLEEIMLHKTNLFLYVQKYYRAFMQDKPIDQYPVFTIQDSK